MFSVPLNPKLTEKQFYDFLNFCKTYKDYIYDVYFTSRIPPFMQDAMGDIFVLSDDNLQAIEAALFLQQETGIKVSATFNNIQIRPDQRNLDTWIANFKPLYAAGIKSCTLPHSSWMMTGQIKSNFPKLFVKNTILRSVKEPREVAKLAEAGFDYVNLERDLMRDHDRLREIKKVKDKYGIKLSLLANEGCLGGCPVMDEHYHFNNTRTGPQYFNDPISRISCAKWDYSNSAIALKTANFPPWREDWLELMSFVDVIKMHGRESITRLYETMDIIKRFANKEEILFDQFNDYIKDTHLEHKPIDGWRKKIKTCKFDCWDCNYCDKVWWNKGNTNNKKIELVSQAIVDSVNDSKSNDIEGLTSNRVKQLLNRLGKLSTHYLEVGVLNGATFCAAIENNEMTCYAVDHWQEKTVSNDGTVDVKASKETFVANVKKYKGKNTVKVFDCDFLKVDLSQIDSIDFLFYDGDHRREMTAAAVRYFSKKLQPNSILVFDDANWEGVVDGVNTGIKDSGLSIAYSKMILNDQESKQDWWNGLYIVVIGG